MSLKVVNQNVFKFFKFSGMNFSWGGGQALVQWMGGLKKFSPDGGTPSPHQEKNPGPKPTNVEYKLLDIAF